MYLADELKRNKPNNWLEEDIDFSEVPPIISPPRTFRPKTSTNKFSQNSQCTSYQQISSSMRCSSDLNNHFEDSLRNLGVENQFFTPRNLNSPGAESTRESIMNQSKNSKISSINWKAVFYN